MKNIIVTDIINYILKGSIIKGIKFLIKKKQFKKEYFLQEASEIERIYNTHPKIIANRYYLIDNFTRLMLSDC